MANNTQKPYIRQPENAPCLYCQKPNNWCDHLQCAKCLEWFKDTGAESIGLGHRCTYPDWWGDTPYWTRLHIVYLIGTAPHSDAAEWLLAYGLDLVGP